MTTLAPPKLRFDPPGPGSWMLDVTHHGRKPVTQFFRPYGHEAFTQGMPVMLKRYGLPLDRFLIGYVHGLQYMRPLAIDEPEKSNGGSPPKPLLWLVSRLHPEMRRRNKTARKAWNEKRWRKDVDAWFEGGKRDEAVAANRAIQAVDVGALGDTALLAHLDETLANFRMLGRMGFVLHGGDIVPTGITSRTASTGGSQSTKRHRCWRGRRRLHSKRRDCLRRWHGLSPQLLRRHEASKKCEG